MTRRIRVAPAAFASAGLLAGAWLLGAQPALAATTPAAATDAPVGTAASVAPGTRLDANAFGGNAEYGHAVISHTDPANGTLSIGPNGDYSYTPKAGFTGTDSFTVSSSDAVKLYETGGADLGVFGGVPVTGNGYGSSVAPVPGKPGFIYGLTDRGPNVDGAGGVKVEPIPDFTPAIGEFQLVGGQAVLVRDIPLKDADGSLLNGQVSTEATTGETIVDLDGNPLPASPYGFDSEGLVAMPDGTFYVSDEYGPYIAHFDANGTRLDQFSPFDGSLPAELKNRTANQGTEGLTITPDGTTLVGLMQSALNQPDLAGVNAKKVPATRIVTISLVDHSVHEYLYLTTDPATTADASSEITALSSTEFLVLERDGNLPPAPNRKLVYKVDISAATDVGPDSTVADSTYDPANGGLLLAGGGATGTTIESFVGAVTTEAAQAALTTRGIVPGAKSEYLNLTSTLADLSPEGTFFGHDKVEGVFPIDGGSKLFISNDSDFGLKGTVAGATNPFVLDPKINADGTQDQGEYLEVDLTKLPATQTVMTVTITVAAVAAPGGGTTPAGTAGGAGGTLAATGAAPALGLGLGVAALLAGAAVLGVATRRRRA